MTRTKWQPYLYLAPAALLLLVFSIYPLIHTLDMSLHVKWGKPAQEFVGLQNYKNLLHDEEFSQALGVSIWYVLGTVPVALFLSFLIANILFQKLRARGMFRTIYFLPYVTSTVAAAMVFRWIFAPDSAGLANAVLLRLAGLVNTVASWFGAGPFHISPQRWFLESTGVFQLLAEGLGVHWPAWAAGPSLALVCIILFSIWHALGFDVVIFLAGLSAIPREMYEAAQVDGAGALERLRHITFPLLSPTLFFLTVISVIRSFQTFNQIYVLTREQSVGTTQNLTMLIFNQFYDGANIGAATATAVVLFLILLGLTAFQMRVLGPRVHY